MEIGKRYFISFREGIKPYQNYEGGAVLVALSDPNYPKGAMKFLCDDGDEGYFEQKDVKCELPKLIKNMDESILDDVIYALSLHKDNCRYASEAYNVLIEFKNSK